MKHLYLYLTIFAMPASALLFSQTTYVDNGTSSSYTLQSGDSLYISNGTYTGSITNWSGGSTITVATGATLSPASINGFRSKYVVYGTANFPSISSDNGFELNNYGTITVNGGVQVNGSSQVWTNNSSGIIKINGSFTFNTGASGSIFTNYGEIEITNEFNVYGNVTIRNNKSIVVAGNINANYGQITNKGLFFTSGTLTFSETVYYTNTCRTGAENGINISSSGATVHNSGLLWASYSKSASSFTNSGTYISAGKGMIKTWRFANYNIMRGNGFMYISGKSTLAGSASVGVSGTTSDSLKIYTVNRTNTSQIFDEQWGTVYDNARYAVFEAPDTVMSRQACSPQQTFAVLPVVWNEFSVGLSAGIPVVKWAATFDEGTGFEVERSSDGVRFVSINKVSGAYTTTKWEFEDKTLPAALPPVIYYRVKATEPDGTQQYTDVKSIKFSTKSSHSLRAWPNPFSNRLTLNYKANQKTIITIKIYDTHGRKRLVKRKAVNAGDNKIIMAEAGALKKGSYVVKIVADNGGAVSAKLVKK
ncbi:MAG: T9SS type A sorting domain-containing protein [Agriterribacter sp.]